MKNYFSTAIFVLNIALAIGAVWTNSTTWVYALMAAWAIDNPHTRDISRQTTKQVGHARVSLINRCFHFYGQKLFNELNAKEEGLPPSSFLYAVLILLNIDHGIRSG
ncbi:hypothetical protein [Fictibacillus fluitans]|uniref:Uncharacterized protein n=1 Tax=Fictibacillus fluitans TaxID=3058422 RepID=A0ABT8I0R3_9BACL|nr:hypothetical protein [Fictibacillus sp. NE201]MDN4526619.1 hypothetical protein [Fictibacillus sp. NE201]